MIKEIALLSILGVLAGCASEPPLTAQDIKKMATEAAASAPFYKVDKDRELTVAFENNYLFFYREEWEKNQNLQHALAITDSYSNNLWSIEYSCFMIAKLYNTGNKEYASVTNTVSGVFLSSDNAWVPFKVSGEAGKIPPFSQKLVAIKLNTMACKQLKDVKISLTTCIDVGVGDRRCQ